MTTPQALTLGLAAALLASAATSQRARLVFEPATETVDTGGEGALVLRLEPGPNGAESGQVTVTLSGAEDVVAQRLLALASGESAPITVRCAEPGTHRLTATAEGARSGRALVVCSRPSLEQRSARRPGGVATFALRPEAAPAVRRRPVEVRYAASLDDGEVQEVLGWLAEGRSIESVAAQPEQLALARELVGAMNRPGTFDVQVLPEGVSAGGVRFVRNRVLLPGRDQPVDVQQAATSEATQPQAFEPGALRLQPLADSSLPSGGDWEPVPVAAVWEQDGQPKRRVFPLTVELSSSGLPGLAVEPRRLEIPAREAVSERPAVLDSEVAGRAELRAFWEGRLSEPPAVVEFRPAPPAALRIAGVPETVHGIARVRLRPVIQLVSDVGAPAAAERPVRVGVVLTERGGESWNRELEIAAGETQGSLELDLERHGDYRLEVSSAELGRKTIDFEVAPTWWPLITALAAGLLGALARLLMRPEEARARRWLRVLAGGGIAAVLVLLLQQFGALSALSGVGGWAEALAGLPGRNLFAAGVLGFFGGFLFEQVLGGLLGRRGSS